MSFLERDEIVRSLSRENDFLRSKLTQYENMNQRYRDDFGRLILENTRLTACVDKLMEESRALTWANEGFPTTSGFKELKSQICEMTKAGDNLERILTSHISSYEVGNASHEWRASKKKNEKYE